MIVDELTLLMPKQKVYLLSGRLEGNNVSEAVKKLGQLECIFANEEARQLMNPETIVYTVQVHEPVERDTEGGLLFGTTFLMPGKVADEYFMTQGHFHKIGNRGEYYWGINGNGILLLMDRQRNCRVEMMQQGSLHYIPADTGHRVVNCGNDVLSFGACWPADAGYDYLEIKTNGFSVRVVEENGNPVLVPSKI